MNKSFLECRLKGASIGKGIAMGKICYHGITEDLVPLQKIAPSQIQEEIERFKKALKYSLREITRLKEKMEEQKLEEGVKILQGQLEAIQDPFLSAAVEGEIHIHCIKAESALHNVRKVYADKQEAIKDPFFMERISDIQEIIRRMIAYLLGAPSTSLKKNATNAVIFAKQLSAANAAEADCETIKAFVVLSGGRTSHAAIVARARDIPFVSGIEIYNHNFPDETMVIVDGYRGEVIVNPSDKTYNMYLEKIESRKKFYIALNKESSFNPFTKDKKKIKLAANIDVLAQIPLFHELKGERVGLFRSELNFQNFLKYPQEEEQYTLYKNLIEALKGAPCIIRTFDLGGDKFHHENMATENNPFLGCRATRYLLLHPVLFKMHLRAILRAGALGPISILLPIISSVAELIEAKKIIYAVQKDLIKEGIACAHHVLIGCMIEVPSAALTADILAKECDFFSIGTNDLVQYCLAVDRGNSLIASLYAPCDPSVLRLLKIVIAAAKKEGIPLSLCGEVAGDPLYTALFLGMGITEFSLSLKTLPQISHRITKIELKEAKKLAEKAFTLSKAEEVRNLLEEHFMEEVIV
jgi:phosphoenolpyruvate-protein phosphotransferase (PTS system enzyme I)